MKASARDMVAQGLATRLSRIRAVGHSVDGRRDRWASLLQWLVAIPSLGLIPSVDRYAVP